MRDEHEHEHEHEHDYLGHHQIKKARRIIIDYNRLITIDDDRILILIFDEDGKQVNYIFMPVIDFMPVIHFVY